MIREFLSLCTVVGYTNELKDMTVAIRKSSALKLPDAIIAATSSNLKLPLITADKQFKRVENLNIIYYHVV